MEQGNIFQDDLFSKINKLEMSPLTSSCLFCSKKEQLCQTTTPSKISQSLDFQAVKKIQRLKSLRTQRNDGLSVESIMNFAEKQASDLSRMNQQKNIKKIKTEEQCFRFKLKMITFLQKMHINQEEIQELKNISSQNCLLFFFSKLKQYINSSQKTTSQNQLHMSQLRKQSLQKSEKISQLCSQVSLLRVKLEKEKERWSRKIQENLQVIDEKNEQISRLNSEIYCIKASISERNIRNPLQQGIKNIQKDAPMLLLAQTAKFQKQEGKTDDIGRGQRIKEREKQGRQQNRKMENNLLSEMVREWKEKTEHIVEYYEKRMKDERKLTEKRENEIVILQETLQKYIKNKL